MARVTPTFYFLRNVRAPWARQGAGLRVQPESSVLAQGLLPALFLHCCSSGALSAARPWWAEALCGLRLDVWGMAQSQAKTEAHSAVPLDASCLLPIARSTLAVTGRQVLTAA